MAGRECDHCKQWVKPDEPYDCWTTTEAALTRDLPENLRRKPTMSSTSRTATKSKRR
jgi:hypothetical protein